MTTRPCRGSNDRDYHFVSEDDFLQAIRDERLIENIRYHGNFYGVPVPPDDGAHLIVVEPIGAMQILRWSRVTGRPALLVYFDCPKEVIAERMRKRGDTEASIRERLSLDDYFEVFKPLFHHVLPTQGDLEENIVCAEKVIREAIEKEKVV
jgi:guanylate kinase